MQDLFSSRKKKKSRKKGDLLKMLPWSYLIDRKQWRQRRKRSVPHRGRAGSLLWNKSTLQLLAALISKTKDDHKAGSEADSRPS